MKALTDFATDALEWRAADPSGTRFELVSVEGHHATLGWSPSDTLARVETSEGNWTLLRVGVLAKHVTVREEGAHSNLAEFHRHALGKGRLEFRDGATFLWTHLHHQAGWAFQDLEGHELLRIQPWPMAAGRRPEPGMILARVLVQGKGMARWRDAFLAALGWYLLLLDTHDAEVQEGALVGSNLI